jgi:hypothetical protein
MQCPSKAPEELRLRQEIVEIITGRVKLRRNYGATTVLGGFSPRVILFNPRKISDFT